MDQETQLVFLHKGYSWYLPYTIYQAKLISPISEIVFISDGVKFKGIKNIRMSRLNDKNLVEFNKYYSHMSTNPKSFELFCFERWFLLLNYMKIYNIQSVIHLDTDVLLYSSIDDIREAYSSLKWECGLLIPEQDPATYQWGASGHFSFWTIKMLEYFCHFLIFSFKDKNIFQKYKKKWDWHIENKKPGGICDMTSLYLFWQENRKDIINLAKEFNSNVIDHNINSYSNYKKDQYIMQSGIKKVVYKNGSPFFQSNLDPDSFVRVHALHLQGKGKNYIDKFFVGKSIPFKLYNTLNNNLILIISKICKLIERHYHKA